MILGFALIGLLGGLLVGGRFKVLALLPVEGLALAVVAAQALAGSSLLTSALGFAAFSLCLQAGYAIRITGRSRFRQPGPFAAHEA